MSEWHSLWWPGHLKRRWCTMLSDRVHKGQSSVSDLLILVRCLLSPMWPVWSCIIILV
jgi:hypothetical protein